MSFGTSIFAHILRLVIQIAPICGPPQEFDAKGESMLTKSFYFKKKLNSNTLSTLAILPH